MCLSHGLRETKRTELNDYSRKYPAVPSKLVLECALNAIYFKKIRKTSFLNNESIGLLATFSFLLKVMGGGVSEGLLLFWDSNKISPAIPDRAHLGRDY